jgi:hypothetical protein
VQRRAAPEIPREHGGMTAMADRLRGKRMVGAKRALKPQQVWAIRFWLDRERRLRDRALFDLAIDSKLRGCDLVKIRIGDLVSGGRVRAVQILLGHTKIESTVRYLGVDVEDALTLAEHTEVKRQGRSCFHHTGAGHDPARA